MKPLDEDIEDWLGSEWLGWLASSGSLWSESFSDCALIDVPTDKEHFLFWANRPFEEVPPSSQEVTE